MQSKRGGGLRAVIHKSAEMAKRRRSVGGVTQGRGPERLRQIKELHARRHFDGKKWVNWQMGTVLAGGQDDLQ